MATPGGKGTLRDPATLMVSQNRPAGMNPFRTSLPVILIAAGCATGSGPAPRSPAVHDWLEDGFVGRRIVTDHFQVYSTLRDADFEAALPEFVEAAYRQYTATLRPPEPVASKLTMVLFQTRREWARFARRRYPSRYAVYARIRSGGFTEGGTSVSFYVNRAATLATLAHEGWHQYVGTRFDASLPAWLNEGLACRHEAVEFVAGRPRFTPDRNTFRINSLRDGLREERLMSLTEIVNTDAAQVIGEDRRRLTQTYYAQTWALVTFLRRSGRLRPSFDRMLHDIADGTFDVHVSAARLVERNGPGMSRGEAAFRAYFGCPPESLADEYEEHLFRVCGY